jgi:hypothetical protein
VEEMHGVQRVKGGGQFLHLLARQTGLLVEFELLVLLPAAAEQAQHAFGEVRRESPEFGELEVVEVAVAAWGEEYPSCV